MASFGAQIIKETHHETGGGTTIFYFDRGYGFENDKNRCKSYDNYYSDYGFRITNKTFIVGDKGQGTYSVMSWNEDSDMQRTVTTTRVENFVNGKKHGPQFSDGKQDGGVKHFQDGVEDQNHKTENLSKS